LWPRPANFSVFLSAKFTFTLTSEDRKRPMPHKILIGQQPNETVRHIALKCLAWLLFCRERLQIDTDVQNDSIPFVPDLAVLGYDMRPLLWVECGECSVSKLHKIAVKCPEAEIWIVKKSITDARHLLATMEKEELRKGRYSIVALDLEFFDEVCGLIRERNEVYWYRGDFDPPEMRFELNELWFETTFEVLRW
jgi:uncharacterized protein YaeQ